MRWFFTWLLRLRWPFLGLLAAVTAWLGSYLWPPEEISFDFSFDRLFIAYGGDRDGLREFQRDFGNDVGILSTLVVLPEPSDARPKDPRVTGTVFEPRVVRVLASLAQHLKDAEEIDAKHVFSLGELANLHSQDGVQPNFIPGQLTRLETSVLDQAEWLAQMLIAHQHNPAAEPPLPPRLRDELVKLPEPEVTAWVRAAAAPGWAGAPELASELRGWAADVGVAAVERPGTLVPAPTAVEQAVVRYQQAKAALLRHRIYLGQVVSSDARTTMVVARFGLAYRSVEDRAPLLESYTAAVDQARAELPAGSETHVTGVPAIEQTYRDVMMTETGTHMPLVAAAMMLLLLGLFRRFTAMLFPMVGVGLATVWGIGFMLQQGEPINILSNIIPVIILVIGVAESVHILARYYQLSLQIEDKREAIVLTMCQIAPACFLASATTAIGFGSLVSATIPAIRSFGLYSAFAILFVLFIQLTFIPIMLSLAPMPRALHIADPGRTWTGRAMARLAELIRTRSRAIMWTAALVSVVSVVGLLQVSSETRMLQELQREHPAAQALYRTQEELTGVLVHAVGFRGKEYPKRACATDDDCALGAEACDPAACPYPGCCHTAVCRRDDRAWRLINTLREITSDLTDADELPLFDQLRSAVDEMRDSQLFGPGSGAAPPSGSPDAGGDSDAITIEEDEDSDEVVVEDEDEGEEIVIDDGEGEAPSNASTPAPVAVSAASKTGHCVESIKNVGFIRALAELGDWAASSKAHAEIVSRVSSPVDLLREMNLSYTDPSDDSNYRLAPELDRDKITGLLMPFEGNLLSRLVTKDYTRSNLTIFAFDAGTTAWRALEADLETKLAELFGQRAGVGDKVDYQITGSATLTQNALGAVVSDMGTSLALAFVLILLLLTAIFRSIRVGIVSMIPNVAPLFYTLALMGAIPVELRISSVVIFSVSLGIAVDDTIHFISRLRLELRDGYPVEEATRRAIHGTGRAIVLATVILCLGFMMNANSDLIALQQFGLLSSFTLVMAMIGCLFVLPILARAFGLHRIWRPRTDQAGEQGTPDPA